MNNFITLLRKSILGLNRYLAILLVAWLVMMVSLPFIKKLVGEQTFEQGLALFVLLQLLFVLQVLYRAWGWWSTLRVSVGVVLFAWVAEAIDIRSGYPFGNLHFTQSLQPQVGGVPLLVPLMWLMMLPPAWAVAKLISRRVSGCLLRPVFILTSALAFTAWNLYLDPQMVQWGLWEWNPTGGYFGIPWLGLLGWFVVSGIISLAVSPKRLPGGLLVLVYGLTWLVEFIKFIVVLGMPGPALAGFLAMGSLLAAAALVTQ